MSTLAQAKPRRVFRRTEAAVPSSHRRRARQERLRSLLEGGQRAALAHLLSARRTLDLPAQVGAGNDTEDRAVDDVQRDIQAVVAELASDALRQV